MFQKKFSARMAKTLRIPVRGRNSFVATLEDFEQAKITAIEVAGSKKLESMIETSAPTALPSEPISELLNNPSLEVSLEEVSFPIEVERRFDPTVVESVATEIGSSLSFIVGLVSASKSPLGSELVETFASELAVHTGRVSCCIRVGAESASVQPRVGVVESNPPLFFETWNLTESRTGSSGTLQASVRLLPSLKSRYPLIVLDMGSINRQWVEPLGRMCDAVYVVLPDHGALSPSATTSKVIQLQRAHVPVRGSWIADAA